MRRQPSSERRQFLRLAAAGGLALAGATRTLGSTASRGTKAGDDWDVIVIGGGFAGVTAARNLSLRGRRTLLLEARPRLGGRTFTAPFGNHEIELGGNWIGSAQPFVWSELSQYGLQVEESAATAAEQAIWWDQGVRKANGLEAYAAVYEPAANAFYAPAKAAFPRPFEPLFVADEAGLDQISARDAIDQLALSPAQRDLLRSFAAINGHSHSDRSSYLDQLRWFALGGYDIWRLWDNLSRFRIKGGTAALLDRINADSKAQIQLASPVKSVVQKNSTVEVRTGSGQTFRARLILVAVPLNCLVDIDFQPGLSATKREASRRRHTGSGTKLYAAVQQKLPVFFGHGRERDPLCFAWTEYDDADSQLLCGFGASPALLDVNDSGAVQAAFAQYMPEVRIHDSVSHDWNLDPFAKGTWCMYPPGLLTDALEELQRPEGNIFFAGGDIANGWRGFIDGAIESGAVAAGEIHNYLS